MMMGHSIYGVAVISESLYSRFYGIPIYWNSEVYTCIIIHMKFLILVIHECYIPKKFQKQN